MEKKAKEEVFLLKEPISIQQEITKKVFERNSCLCKLNCLIVLDDNESEEYLKRLLGTAMWPGRLQTAGGLDVSVSWVDVPDVELAVNLGFGWCCKQMKSSLVWAVSTNHGLVLSIHKVSGF